MLGATSPRCGLRLPRLVTTFLGKFVWLGLWLCLACAVLFLVFKGCVIRWLALQLFVVVIWLPAAGCCSPDRFAVANLQAGSVRLQVDCPVSAGARASTASCSASQLLAVPGRLMACFLAITLACLPIGRCVDGLSARLHRRLQFLRPATLP